MILAFAVLLIHPQIGPKVSFPVEKIALIQPASSTSTSTTNSLTNPPATTDAMTEATAIASAPEASAPAISSAPEASLTAPNLDALPDAPAPAPAVGPNTGMAFIKPGKSTTVTVGELLAENRRKQLLWRGLTIASSGAATFDAWSTRQAITHSGAQELNPLLKPFAGNASLYAAIQVGPALMDYVGKKMLYSRHTWVRRMWWVPQTASFVSSVFCGSHNLAFH